MLLLLICFDDDMIFRYFYRCRHVTLRSSDIFTRDAYFQQAAAPPRVMRKMQRGMLISRAISYVDAFFGVFLHFLACALFHEALFFRPPRQQ